MKKKPSRRVILLKQSKQVSPVKDIIPQPLSKQQNSIVFDKPKIPHIQSNQNTRKFNTNEIEDISNNADSLVSVQLMRKVIQRERNGLQHSFFQETSPMFKDIFDITIKNVIMNLMCVKQQRLQRLKEDSVIFVPPNKDYYEIQQGKILNIWIKQQLGFQKTKCNIQENTISNTAPLYKFVEQKIALKSHIASKEEVQGQYLPKVQEVKMNNQNVIRHKQEKVKSMLLEAVQLSDQMRRNRVIMNQTNKKRASCNCSEKYPHHGGCMLKGNNPKLNVHIKKEGLKINPEHYLSKHRNRLFMPEDYFF